MGSNSCALKAIKYPESLRKLSEFHSSITCFSLKEKKEGKKKKSLLPHCIEQFLKSSPIPVNNTAKRKLSNCLLADWVHSVVSDRNFWSLFIQEVGLGADEGPRLASKPSLALVGLRWVWYQIIFCCAPGEGRLRPKGIKYVFGKGGENFFCEREES